MKKNRKTKKKLVMLKKWNVCAYISPKGRVSKKEVEWVSALTTAYLKIMTEQMAHNLDHKLKLVVTQ